MNDFYSNIYENTLSLTQGKFKRLCYACNAINYSDKVNDYIYKQFEIHGGKCDIVALCPYGNNGYARYKLVRCKDNTFIIVGSFVC